jgi:tagatose 1,6-diphosphate aldolase
MSVRSDSTVPKTLLPGKAWGLRRLADSHGCFAMVAIDQRPPIAQLIAKARGVAVADVAFADMVALKRLLAEGLVDAAGAMLVDPNFGMPACADLLRADRGLIVTLEEHRFGETPNGRLSESIPNWSVEQIARLGGDAVKVLAWYRPDASNAVREHQRQYVQKVGAECAAHGLPFVFELLTYPFPRDASSLRDYVEDPDKLPELVIDSVREFADPRYGVDVFKLESPLPMSTLPDPQGHDAVRVQAMFDRMGQACGDRPWVMLSAGSTMAAFERAVTYACRAGASGFLAGRAVWWEAAKRWPDEAAMRQLLQGEANDYVLRLTEIVHRVGRPWRPRYDWSGIQQEGQFARA